MSFQQGFLPTAGFMTNPYTESMPSTYDEDVARLRADFQAWKVAAGFADNTDVASRTGDDDQSLPQTQ